MTKTMKGYKLWQKIMSASLCLAALTMAACSEINNNMPEMPEMPGMGGGMGGGSDDTQAPDFDPVIYPYQDQKATDATADVVGENEDIYHELNDFSTKVYVAYDGAKATVTTDSKSIISHVDGAHVVIDMLTNSVKNVNVILSGASADGSLKIYGEKKFMLTLAGVELESTIGPAINSQCKKRVFVEVSDGTVNSLTDASTYSDDTYYPDGVTSADEDRKGCFFSEGNMIFSGCGVLKVAGRTKHGIATDGYFWMRPGVTIAVTEAKKNAVHVKGSTSDNIGVSINGGLLYTNVASEAGKGIKTDMMVEINGGELQLNTSGNAVYDTDEQDTSSAACIKADGEVIINGGNLTLKSTGTGGKGINTDTDVIFAGGVATITTTGGKYYYTQNVTSSPKGVKADGNVTITGGELNICVTGRSDGSEGLESKKDMVIGGGNVYVYAYDDAINAGTSLTINGGNVFSHSVNNDGIDSNGKLTVNAGIVIASGATSPEESFDSDNSNNFKVNGGTLIGIAGGCTSPNTSSTQYSLLYNGLSASKDTMLGLVNKSGELIVAYKLHRSLSGLTLMVSSAGMSKGDYTIMTGGTVSGSSAQWQGCYIGGQWSGGTSAASVTLSSTVTTYGNTGMGGGGMGGGMGGGGMRP